MQKGKLGICLPFYAILALILAFMGQLLLGALLIGFVALVERDEWATRQTMQAFFVTLFTSLISWIFDSINVFVDIPIVGSAISTVFNVIEGIIGIVVLIFLIIGLVHVVKGQDAGIPVFSKLAARAFGIVQQKVYTQAPPAGGYQPYQQQPPYQQPQQPQNPQNPQNYQNPQNPGQQ